MFMISGHIARWTCGCHQGVPKSICSICCLHLVSINVKHENIAKLIGYGSSEVLERAEQFEDAKLGAKEDKETSYYFVEEYMPNGSLDKIIYGTLKLNK